MDSLFAVGVGESERRWSVGAPHGHLDGLAGQAEGCDCVGGGASPGKKRGEEDCLPGMRDPYPSPGFGHQEIANVLAAGIVPSLSSGPETRGTQGLGKRKSVHVPMERLPGSKKFQNSPGWEQ